MERVKKENKRLKNTARADQTAIRRVFSSAMIEANGMVLFGNEPGTKLSKARAILVRKTRKTYEKRQLGKGIRRV